MPTHGGLRGAPPKRSGRASESVFVGVDEGVGSELEAGYGVAGSREGEVGAEHLEFAPGARVSITLHEDERAAHRGVVLEMERQGVALAPDFRGAVLGRHVVADKVQAS